MKVGKTYAIVSVIRYRKWKVKERLFPYANRDGNFELLQVVLVPFKKKDVDANSNYEPKHNNTNLIYICYRCLFCGTLQLWLLHKSTNVSNLEIKYWICHIRVLCFLCNVKTFPTWCTQNSSQTNTIHSMIAIKDRLSIPLSLFHR